MKPAKAGSASATAGGIAALAIWSSTVAVVRSAGESVGALTAGAVAMAGGGALGLAVAWARGRSPARLLALPRKYLLGCGGLFVAYEVCIYAAIGLAVNRSAVLVVGLANYLWPALTVVLSVPLLGRRARWPLGLGALLAVGGTAAATLAGPEFRWDRLAETGPATAAPLLLAAAGAVLWAIYSNLVKRWGRPEAGAVPLFLLASAAALALLRLGRPESPAWTPKAVGELCFLGVFQSLLAYGLWEAGMRRGNHLLLSLLSYFTPIASVALAAAYLGVLPGKALIAGCALVTAGALICKLSVREGQHARRPD